MKFKFQIFSIPIRFVQLCLKSISFSRDTFRVVAIRRTRDRVEKKKGEGKKKEKKRKKWCDRVDRLIGVIINVTRVPSRLKRSSR